MKKIICFIILLITISTIVKADFVSTCKVICYVEEDFSIIIPKRGGGMFTIKGNNQSTSVVYNIIMEDN